MTDSSDAELEPSVQLMDKMLQDLGDEDVLAAESPRSRSGRLIKVKSKAWPYADQPAHAPSAKSSAQQSGSDLVAPQRSRKRPMPAPPSNPKVKLRFELPDAAEPEAPHEECAWPNPSELQPSERAASPGTLMLLFSDVLKALEAEAAACPGSPVSTIDLECTEHPAVAMGDMSKRVTWMGLPANPPEWKTGPRKAIPRTWQPCKHVAVSEGMLCLRRCLASEEEITTLPVYHCNTIWT